MEDIELKTKLSIYDKLEKEKVLVCTATSDSKNYCWDEWYDRYKNLSYQNKDLYIVDNSMDRDNVKRLSKLGIRCDHLRPKQKSSVQYVSESQELLRQYFLKTDAQWFFSLESDIIPPQDVIERLLSHQKAIVGGLYFVKFGEDSHLCVQQKETIGENIFDSLTYESPYDINFIDGKLKTVHHCGLGCVMIHRSVLKKIKLRWEKGAFAFADTYFAIDCGANNFTIHADTSILCEHRNSMWVDIIGGQ